MFKRLLEWLRPWKFIVRKRQAIDISTLNRFLKLLPDQPVAKVVGEFSSHRVVQFRIKMPKVNKKKVRLLKR